MLAGLTPVLADAEVVASDQWEIAETSCEVLTVTAAELPMVSQLARNRVAAVAQACSRLRPDSEVNGLVTGTAQRISPLLAGVIAAQLRTTELGFDQAGPADSIRPLVNRPVASRTTAGLIVDLDQNTLLLPPEFEFDLGEVVWAWAADWIAEACLSELDTGVLVNLGGDIAVRGEPPDGGWRIQIDDRQPSPSGDDTISMSWPGGLASVTNATSHGIDPGVPQPWRTVTVAAHSCERAKAACLAALTLGDSAPRWLTQREFPARLVHTAGVTITTPGWPG